MRTFLRRGQTAGARSGPGWPVPSRVRRRFRSALESGVLAGLLIVVVASVMVGSQVTVLGAWLALGSIVGVRNVLDAGCIFMLLVVGVILVVDLVTNGPGSFLR